MNCRNSRFALAVQARKRHRQYHLNLPAAPRTSPNKMTINPDCGTKTGTWTTMSGLLMSSAVLSKTSPKTCSALPPPPSYSFAKATKSRSSSPSAPYSPTCPRAILIVSAPHFSLETISSLYQQCIAKPLFLLAPIPWSTPFQQKHTTHWESKYPPQHHQGPKTVSLHLEA